MSVYCIQFSGREIVVSASIELCRSSRKLPETACKILILRPECWICLKMNCILQPEVENFTQAGSIEPSGRRILVSTNIELSLSSR